MLWSPDDADRGYVLHSACVLTASVLSRTKATVNYSAHGLECRTTPRGGGNLVRVRWEIGAVRSVASRVVLNMINAMCYIQEKLHKYQSI